MDLIAFLKNSCIQNHRELWKLFCMCWMSLWTLLVFVCSCMSPIKWKSPRGTSPTRTTRASRRKRRSNGRKRQRKSSDCSPTPGQCRRPRVCHQVINVHALLSGSEHVIFGFFDFVIPVVLRFHLRMILLRNFRTCNFYCRLTKLVLFLHSTLLHVLYTCTK